LAIVRGETHPASSAGTVDAVAANLNVGRHAESADAATKYGATVTADSCTDASDGCAQSSVGSARRTSEGT
jgi:hypothetical protein